MTVKRNLAGIELDNPKDKQFIHAFDRNELKLNTKNRKKMYSKFLQIKGKYEDKIGPKGDSKSKLERSIVLSIEIQRQALQQRVPKGSTNNGRFQEMHN